MLEIKRKISLSIEFRGQTRRLILRKRNVESWLHILCKVLAYVYFWEDDLLIEPNFEFHGYTPDLLRLDRPVNPKQIEDEIGIWVECKTVKLKKMADLVRYSDAKIFWFHLKSYFERLFRTRAYQKYKRIRNVINIGIDWDTQKISAKTLLNTPQWRIVAMEDNSRFNIYLPSELDPIEIDCTELTV